MAHSIAHTIFAFKMGDKTYYYNDIPIEMYYFYILDGAGVWIGKSNLALPGENMPNKYFNSTEDAFEKMTAFKKADSKKYLYGLVVNFETKKFYYDTEDIQNLVKYWSNDRLEQITYLAEGVRVRDWNTVPT